MADMKDKLVDLESLKAFSDDTTAKLGGKLAVPLNEGTEGQVLTAKGDGTSEWKDAQGGLSINKEDVLVDQEEKPVKALIMTMLLTQDTGSTFLVANKMLMHMSANIFTDRVYQSGLRLKDGDDVAKLEVVSEHLDANTSDVTDSVSCRMVADYGRGKDAFFESKIFADGPRSASSGQFVKLGITGYSESLSSSNPVSVDIDERLVGYIAPFDASYQAPGLIAPDNATTVVANDDGVLSVKDGGITMSKLAKDVKDAIAGNAPTIDEADVRRIVNEQLAKMKFTINDQGHLIIETPEA